MDPYLVATKATPDASVSHHSALQFYGRTYSLWNQVTFLTTSHTRAFSFGPNRFVPTRPVAAVANLPNMGGHIDTVRLQGGDVRVCTRERAMVDVLHAPSLGGGWEEVWRSLQMVEFFDLDVVIAYAIRLHSATTVARVGVFLERHRERLFVDERHLARLAQHAPKQARYLDSTRENGRLQRPWNLIVPERILEERWEQGPG